MGGGGEVKALLVFRALAYAVGKTKCAFTCGWFFFCRLVYNEFLYDLCDWKIGDFSAVANR